jgi:hypothetical protein
VNGDYLWDRSGPADPEIVRLERLLGPFGRHNPPLPFRAPAIVPPRASPTFVAIAAVAAACVLALVGLTWTDRAASVVAWDVTRVTGSPLTPSGPITDHVRLGGGAWIDTRADGRVSIAVGEIGQVQAEPDTRIALLDARRGRYGLHLDRGTIHAVIWSPPGAFFVDTASATAVDLGCAYTMTVDAMGTGLVRVTSGWVGFEWQGREAFIPEGAVCRTRPGLGPGTPHFEETTPAFRAALDVIDEGAAPDADRAAAHSLVLEEAGARDRVTLWHLLTRVGPADRDRVFDRLAAFVAPPAGVTRDGIRRGRQDMLDRWWDDLGLGSTNWWRVWEQHWRPDRPVQYNNINDPKGRQ